MKTESVVYVGVDVSKASLQFDAGDIFTGSVANAAAAVKKALAALGRKAPEGARLHVCFEATGPYTRVLSRACAAAGVAASTLNPCKVRQYAKSMSVNAKTDPVDARMIRLFAEHRGPEPDAPQPEGRAEARELAAHRVALHKQLTAVRGRAEGACAAAVRNSLAALAGEISRQIEKADERLRELRDADAHVSGLCAELGKIGGVGELTAMLAVALAPELGTLGRRRSASLAGLAPHPEDSGAVRGPRHIRGGRFHLRRALYMPALAASRHNPVLAAYYRKKTAEGMPPKKALTAVMRKLFAQMDRAAARWLRESGQGAAPA